MSKLLTGYSAKSQFKVIRESTAPGGDIYIQGPYQIADEPNQNGRKYPRSILFPEVQRYIKEYVKTGRALGELDHPDGSNIAGDRICHRIVDMWIEGNVVMGKSLILDTSKGKEVRAILEGGGIMGVSSRSLGDYDRNGNVTDLQIICWDVVQEPSVSIALVEKLNESYDFCLDENKQLKKIAKNNKYIIDLKRKIILERFKDVFKTF